ncbi:ABC transporter ATP-binding protein [Natrarchaeobius oligotrophus]|uniref:ABC-type D-xylose/L-arabinose transporter n=1 Tax=Natrarchaeobius chitinivorans TaxID=1679083 RepID=A0A3N6PSN4_NATCH|nr:ABC transporter ATP-binding protein [Natrarchaeobius chitinivorans]RQH02566.1 ABC transporter ATP-binding protein [Natrarchaeobius chitinivorans]
MASISLENVTKIFSGDVVAVDDVSLEISDGEFVVLVGPSGSGKSTILRMISGLEVPTDGTIKLDDEDITTAKPKERDLGMVFQNYALYPHLSARENISFGLRMRGGYSDEEIDERVTEAAEMMSMTDYLDHRPNELSGGQKQRVALGRALVRDSKAFLMDEPLSNLDAKLRTQMRTEIQQLQQRLDMTTIYVTHDQTEAMTMGDRIAILNHGELQQFGTPIEAYYRPNNVFVAGFIGSPSMNFIDVSVDHSGDGTSISHQKFEWEVPDHIADSIPSDETNATLGVRPEDLTVNDGDDPQIPVTVDVVEPLGKEQLLHFSLGNEMHIASITEHVLVSEGDEIRIGFDPEDVHLFDAETGTVMKQRESIPEEEPAVTPHGE